MHLSAMYNMEYLFDRYLEDNIKVLEVGSKVTNGQKDKFRDLAKDNWEYIGCDIEKGDNVDVVLENGKYPFENETFDAVVSGNVLEHIDDLDKFIKENKRVLKKGGKLILITCNNVHPEHKHPVDCWRIMPDGMKYILKSFDIQEVGYGKYGQHTVAAPEVNYDIVLENVNCDVIGIGIKNGL